VREVAEHEINAAGHQLTEEVNVPGEPVKLRKDQRGPYYLGVRQSRRELLLMVGAKPVSTPAAFSRVKMICRCSRSQKLS
jgi:hypothetical protein